MPEGKQIVKRHLVDGTLVISEYDMKKYYQNYKDKHGYVECPNCHKIIIKNYYNKHRETKACKNFQQKEKKVIKIVENILDNSNDNIDV